MDILDESRISWHMSRLYLTGKPHYHWLSVFLSYCSLILILYICVCVCLSVYMAEFFKLRLKPIRGVRNVLSGLQPVLKKDNRVKENSASRIEMEVLDFTILILPMCIWNVYTYLIYMCVCDVYFSVYIIRLYVYIEMCIYVLVYILMCIWHLRKSMYVYMIYFYAVYVLHASIWAYDIYVYMCCTFAHY